ncbi:MAG: amino acid permease [Terriglobus roseus]|nr:amino acid permease [Terriglobus roseus]
MDSKTHIPFNSVYLTSFLSGCLCLINLGSTLAFNIIVSLSLLALLSSYTISIGCVLYRRLRGDPLPPARWSLGRWGVWINAMGFLYSLFTIIWCSFPIALPVDGETANYGPALWAGVIALAAIVYVLHGRKHYTPPVHYVEGRKAEGFGIQSVE